MIKLLPAVAIILISSCVSFEEDFDSPTSSAPIGEDHGQYHHYVNTPLPTWGDQHKVWQYRNFYFAGTPNPQTFLHAKASGISIAIDLRSQEKTTTPLEDRQLSGIKIIHIPTTRQNLFSSETLNQFSKTLEKFEKLESEGSQQQKTAENHGDQHLEKQQAASIMILHSTPDEAAALFTAYLSDHSSLNEETCLSIAHSIGLNDQDLELSLKKHLSRN